MVRLMGEHGGVEHAKKELRKIARDRRAQAHRKLAGSAGAALRSSGLDFLDRTPGIVSGFHPYRDEIDCTQLLERLASEGWTVCLPVVIATGQPLEFRAWRPGDRLETGAFGIPVPCARAAVVTPDVVLVPLLAFDAQGYRLGYGGGFYDRSLEALRRDNAVCAVGVAFATQAVDAVPHGPHDEPLDWILTENGGQSAVRADAADTATLIVHRP